MPKIFHVYWSLWQKKKGKVWTFSEEMWVVLDHSNFTAMLDLSYYQLLGFCCALAKVFDWSRLFGRFLVVLGGCRLKIVWWSHSKTTTQLSLTSCRVEVSFMPLAQAPKAAHTKVPFNRKICIFIPSYMVATTFS